MVYDSTGNYRFTDTTSAFDYAHYLGLKYYKVWEAKDNNSNPYYKLYAYCPQFYALGILNQILYVDPERNLIMVRLGKNWDRKSDFGYIYLMSAIGKRFPVD